MWGGWVGVGLTEEDVSHAEMITADVFLHGFCEAATEHLDVVFRCIIRGRLRDCATRRRLLEVRITERGIEVEDGEAGK